MNFLMHSSLLRSRQKGVVLIVSLVALLLMTMIGVTAMRDTGFQERMSGNLRDRNLAFQASESALRAGEDWLMNNATTTIFSVSTNDSASWNGSDSPAPTGSISLSNIELASDPVFHVGRGDYIKPAGQIHDGTQSNFGACIYPVTAHGVGGSADAVVIIQSRYKLIGDHCRYD